jgi:hypothetical protein
MHLKYPGFNPQNCAEIGSGAFQGPLVALEIERYFRERYDLALAQSRVHNSAGRQLYEFREWAGKLYMHRRSRFVDWRRRGAGAWLLNDPNVDRFLYRFRSLWATPWPDDGPGHEGHEADPKQLTCIQRCEHRSILLELQQQQHDNNNNPTTSPFVLLLL